MTDTTPQQADAACQSVWPDYSTSVGIDRQMMRDVALEWLRAWQSAGVDPLGETSKRKEQMNNDPNAKIKAALEAMRVADRLWWETGEREHLAKALEAEAEIIREVASLVELAKGKK